MPKFDRNYRVVVMLSEDEKAILDKLARQASCTRTTLLRMLVRRLDRKKDLAAFLMEN